MTSEIQNKTFRQPIAALTEQDRSANAAELLLQRQEEAKRLALQEAEQYANTYFTNLATTNNWQIKSITVTPITISLDVSERTETVFGHTVVNASLELKYEVSVATPPPPAEQSGSVNTTNSTIVAPPTTEQINNTISRDGAAANSVDLIFPLSNEISIKIEDLPKYVSKLTKLFDFYKQQMKAKGLEVKGYDLSSEIGGLLLFFVQLDVAIKLAENLKPSIVSNPDKMSVLDYETVTLRYIEPPADQTAGATGPVQVSFGPLAPMPEERKFSDGTKRLVRLYNRIDSVVLTNETTGDTLMTTIPLDAGILGINPSTLALIFNIKKIVDEQINAPVPMDLMLCKGKQTSLSKLEDTFKILGIDVNLLTSKVLIQDFLNAYIHPIRELSAQTVPPVPKGCSDEVKERARQLSAAIALHDLQSVFRDNKNVDINEEIAYAAKKQQLIEINKICPETVSTIALFEDIKKLEKLGKIFSEFLEKFNLACIIDEALKCVMPQLSCEEILRDLSVDNFEERLQTAFPRMKNIIKAISLNIQDTMKKEEERRAAAGEPPLNAQQQSQMVLDAINSVIDLEALCKIDIQAIIDLIKALFNIKLPSFNLLDWRFNFKIDFDALILQSILEAIIALIEQLLNELIGCDALDGFVAGIINGNIEAPTGLYGDLLAMAQGDFSFENAGGIIGNGFSNFLSQSSDEFAKLIKFESAIGNPLIGTFTNSGTLGVSLGQPGIVTENVSSINSFGGLVRASTTTSASVTAAGFEGQVLEATVTFDVTKLATTEGQKEFLKEIGKFEYSKRGEQETIQRISDDSIVNLLTDLKNTDSSTLSAGRPSTITSAMSQAGSEEIPELEQMRRDRASRTGRRNRLPRGKNDVFTQYGARNKNRHILDALVLQSEIDGRSALVMDQVSLIEQLKEYIRTCFALLSISETIDLVSARPSLETRLTITAISKIRFPLLYGLLQYPERHALLFGSLGKLTQLDTVGPRLQLLASSPAVKNKMVDPNICRPYNNIYEFRKILMEQAIAPELANKLMDDLVEDDRQRANNLIDSLGKAGKNLNPTDLFTNPDALSLNRNPDGTPIEEMDRIIDDTISNMFDQVKIIFDNEVEGYPNATADSITIAETIQETLPYTEPVVSGFNSPQAPSESDRPKNQEFMSLLNAGVNPVGEEGRRYFEGVKKNKKRVGGVYKQIYDTLKTDVVIGNIEAVQQLDILQQNTATTSTENNLQKYIFAVQTTGLIKGDENLQKYFNGSMSSVLESDFALASSVNQPSWFLEYKELPSNIYNFTLRTSGMIPNRNGEPTSFNEKIIFSGNLVDLSPGLQQELDSITVNGQKNRVSVFNRILTQAMAEVAPRVESSDDTFINLYTVESYKSFTNFLNNSLRNTIISLDDENRLLRMESADPNFPSNKTELINLIDFSPLPTEQQIACGIDTHLLQLQSVTKRVKDRLNNTIPENLINTNSRINTRYSDGKPGHLSEQLMVGLAETYIRTVVLHNIFKALFVLDKYSYDFTNFSFTKIIYDYIENIVTKEISRDELQEDFKKDYKKIFELYKKQQLISAEDGGSDPIKSIIKYQIESCLEMIKKMLPKDTAVLLTTNLAISGTDYIPLNTDSYSFNKRRNFFDTKMLLNVYSNSLRFSNRGTEIYSPERTVSTPPRIEDGEEIPGSTRTYPEETTYRPGVTQAKGYKSNCQYFTDEKYLDKEQYKFGDIEFVFEKFIDLNWNNNYNGGGNQRLRDAVTSIRMPFLEDNTVDRTAKDLVSGVVNLENYKQIIGKLYGVLQTDTSELTEIILYDPNRPQESVFSSVPKFGLRLSMIKFLDDQLADYSLNANPEHFAGYYQFGNIKYNYSLQGSRISNTQRTLVTRRKAGVLRCIKVEESETTARNGNITRETTARYIRDFQCTPIITKTYEVPNSQKKIVKNRFANDPDLSPAEIAANVQMAENIRSESLDLSYEQVFNEHLKPAMLADANYDLLINYCLDLNIIQTLELFNSFLGMNNEPLFRLFDGTKEFIKKNYILNKNSGNFKNRAKKDNYSKNKKNKQEGPSAAQIMKAATTIPINILKGLATAVDPNIFLADKIVLAGKLGFIQPKFKRVEVGDIVKIEGSNETRTIASGEEGVAYDGIYTYAPTGHLIMKRNSSSQGSPITEFTVVAEVQDKKVKKDREGKPITAQGPGKSGVPYDLKAQSYIDTNIDENNVGAFDIRPSTPIFPGEKINIPYSVASLILAPLPVFGPASLTTYNMTFPVGPLFLALEPLIYETPEFKASMPKRKATDTGGNLGTCLDIQQTAPPQTSGNSSQFPSSAQRAAVDVRQLLVSIFFDQDGNLRTLNTSNLNQLRQQIRNDIFQILNSNSISVTNSELDSAIQQILDKLSRRQLTSQNIIPILQTLID